MKACVLSPKVLEGKEDEFVEIVDNHEKPKLIGGSCLVKPIISLISNNLSLWTKGKYILDKDFLKTVFKNIIPGTQMVGIVDQVADDVHGINIGDVVWNNPTLKHNLNTEKVEEDGYLAGFLPLSSNNSKIFNNYKNGTFSETVVYPADLLYPLPIDGKKKKEEILHECAKYFKIGTLSIAMGALENSKLQWSENLLVNAANGSISSSVVLLSLSVYKPKKIYAVGRNKKELEKMKEKMVKTVGKTVENIIICMTHEELEKNKISDVDVVIDFLGNTNEVGTIKTCFNCLRRGGRLICSGGCFGNLDFINYNTLLSKELTIKGSFMYHIDVPKRLIGMMESGILKLPTEENQDVFVEFDEKSINKGIKDAFINRQKSYYLKF